MRNATGNDVNTPTTRSSCNARIQRAIACCRIARGDHRVVNLELGQYRLRRLGQGRIRLDRMLFTATRYPEDYGFIEHTLGEDGDPLDALVILDEPTFPGCLIRCRAIGMFKMTDEAGGDDKVLCVPASDPRMDRLQDLEDLPEFDRLEIQHFFEVYNGHTGVRNQGDPEHVSTEELWDRALTLRLTGSYTVLIEGRTWETAAVAYSFAVAKQGNTPPAERTTPAASSNICRIASSPSRASRKVTCRAKSANDSPRSSRIFKKAAGAAPSTSSAAIASSSSSASGSW